MFGGPNDDMLSGGPGIDYGAGQDGTDTCDATTEQKSSCEL